MKLLFLMMIFYDTVIYLNGSQTELTKFEVSIVKTYSLLGSLDACKGSAIHPRIVITAAECVNGLSPEDVVVKNFWYLLISDVSKIIIHPKYIECDASNNFAILFTETEISQQNSVICLPDATFLNTVDWSNDCSTELLTTKLFTPLTSSLYSCLPPLSYFNGTEKFFDQICQLYDSKASEILKSREVRMKACILYTTNSKCFAYYYTHDVSTCVRSDYDSKQNTKLYKRNYMYFITNWVQDEIYAYFDRKVSFNGVPQVSACILLLIACIVIHLSA